MIDFIDGASCLAATAIALFFLRFWRETRDRLFLLFGLGFVVLALNRLVLTAIDDESEAETLVYLARAGAFALIIAGIVDKNRARVQR